MMTAEASALLKKYRQLSEDVKLEADLHYQENFPQCF